MSAGLEIRDLHVSIENKEILKGVDLAVKRGEIHALMGPNGSGKSTLASTLMGHPRYKITKGEILMDGESVLDLRTTDRAKRGLFLAFQYPLEISGVGLANFLRMAYNALHKSGQGNGKLKGVAGEMIAVMEFRKRLKEKLALLKMEESFADRYLNEGFSGGEKKRCEILQMAILEPKIAVLDETDSGLDIDSVRIVANGVNTLAGPNMGVLIITHYQRILNFIKPQFVHVLFDGRVVVSGGEELAEKLEKKGYDWVRDEAS